MSQIIEIEALDTLFFRDGKPFTMGQDTVGRSIFPPYPSTLYGAIRSAYLANNLSDLDRINAAEDTSKNLKITGIFLNMSGNTAVPVPLDLVKEKNKENALAYLLSSTNRPKGSFDSNTNLGIEERLSFDKNLTIDSPDEAYVTATGLRSYMRGNDTVSIVDTSEKIRKETKVGIGRSNATRATEEGNLYRIQMNRLENISLIVAFEGISLAKTGILRIGGEGKVAFYRTRSEDGFEPIRNRPIEGTNFKLVLLTPAIFKDGWKPFQQNPDLEVTNAAVGKPNWIGGFDVNKQEPKTMRKAVPAGSVFYIKATTSDAINQLKAKTSICDNFDDHSNYINQGFGLFFLAKVS